MAKTPEARQEAQIRAAAYSGGGNGSLNYLDTHDLKPKSLFNAAISGAFGMGSLGGLFGFMGGTFVEDGRRDSAPATTNGQNDRKSRVSTITKYGAIGATVGAIVGAIAAVINAQIHNGWAEKMTRLTLENQQVNNPVPAPAPQPQVEAPQEQPVNANKVSDQTPPAAVPGTPTVPVVNHTQKLLASQQQQAAQANQLQMA